MRAPGRWSTGRESSRLGETGFPSDYKEFVSVYGAGGIGNAEIEGYLSLMTPEVSSDGLPDGEMDEETEVAREDWDEDLSAKPEGMTLGPDRIITWGADAAGDLICWLAEGESPDSWPVLVNSAGRTVGSSTSAAWSHSFGGCSREGSMNTRSHSRSTCVRRLLGS